MVASRIGHVERAIVRAFIASEGKPLRTRNLLRWAYPRFDHYQRWHHTNIYRAASKVAVRLGKDGRAIIWAPNAELARWISGEPRD